MSRGVCCLHYIFKNNLQIQKCIGTLYAKNEVAVFPPMTCIRSEFTPFRYVSWQIVRIVKCGADCPWEHSDLPGVAGCALRCTSAGAESFLYWNACRRTITSVFATNQRCLQYKHENTVCIYRGIVTLFAIIEDV